MPFFVMKFDGSNYSDKTGLLVGGSCALYLVYGAGLQDSDKTTAAVALGILGFLIGMAEFSILGETIESGVAATFVCLAEDPAALRRTKPELYDKIAQVNCVAKALHMTQVSHFKTQQVYPSVLMA